MKDIITVKDFQLSFRRRMTKNIIYVVLLTTTIIVLLPLFSILLSVFSAGLPIIFDAFPQYFLTRTKAPNSTDFGMANAFEGSLHIIIITCFLSIPIGILAGMYLAETKDSHYNNIVRTTAEVLQSVPSIVAGLVILTFWVLPRQTKGYGEFPAGLALSLLMIPIVTRVTEEGLRTVPSSYKEAAIALGIPKWRITTSIVLKGALPVVLAGVMLAVARISGETAPVIFTALDSNFWGGLDKPTATLTNKIFRYAVSPYKDTWVQSAWAMASVLLSFIFLINIFIRTSLGSKTYVLIKKLTSKIK